ncbi:hypothetical protein REPUB_Repub04eG0260500 [Reevesia pubescens]
MVCWCSVWSERSTIHVDIMRNGVFMHEHVNASLTCPTLTRICSYFVLPPCRIVGWHGNMERKKRMSAAMPPAIEGGMFR